MGITNSTEHTLNSYKTNVYDNSGISDITCVNTGNKKKEKGLSVLNDVYTLNTPKQGTAEINARLLNWDDNIYKKGAELKASSVGRFSEITFVDDKEYTITGHPDKWVYDYRQGYSNCGVDSSLNMLAVAGVKDIVEETTSYQAYLKNGTVKTQKYYVWNGTSWEEQTKQITTYPKAQVATEDEFLLWAVQNSKNDQLWYYGQYYGGYLPTPEAGIDIKDYVIHSKNAPDYETIEDLKEAPLEVGGTNAKHWVNMLNYWGVESEAEKLTTKSLIHVQNPNVEKEPVTTITENGKIVVSVVERYDEFGQDIITTTTTETYVKDPEKDDEYKLFSTKVEEVKTHINNEEFYTYVERLTELIDQGKGIVLGGYAYGFDQQKGGGHAISIVGYLSSIEEMGHTTTEITYADGGLNERTESSVLDNEILGFYVIDTGGFLDTNGLTNTKAQLVDCFTLYNFLTDTTYDAIDDMTGEPALLGDDMVFTKENIKNWAEDMSIVGNNRKNILEGNDGSNSIWAGRGNDVLYGMGGDDYLYGEHGEDTIHGGHGNDVLNGGAGNDTYIFDLDDFMSEHSTSTLAASKGSHDYIVSLSGRDNIQFDSGIYDYYVNGEVTATIYSTMEDIHSMEYQNKDGNLVISYNITKTTVPKEGIAKTEYNNNTITIQDYFKKSLYNSILNVVETFNNGATKKESIFNFQQDILSRGHIDYFAYANKNNKLDGSKFMDSIIGGNLNDTINGADNNDILNGGASDDTIKGGKGDDVIYGSYGNDKIYGDAGDDIIKYQKVAAADEDATDFAGGAYGGHDTLYSGAGRDQIELTEYTRDDLMFTKAKNDLVISFGSDKNSSITIASYFSKKGKTSFYDLVLKDGTGISLRGDYERILANSITEKNADGSVNYDAYNYIKGTKADDNWKGGLGNDTIYGGNGNDTLNGGLGADKLYGQNGNNTYEFESKAEGQDTIYTSGNGTSTIKFTTASGVNFDNKGATDAINEYSFTKYKNDLIINYASDSNYADSDNARITISNFFKAKGDFFIQSANGTELNLKTDATIYMNGDDRTKNKITGSNYNDSIIGYDYVDTLNGGKGNDTIVGGKGNDNLTGGAGDNVIKYNKGDGIDNINLTKAENLKIELSGFESTDTFEYNIVKKDLVITCVNEKGKKEDILVLKNFGAKDVTTDKGSVLLYNGADKIKDLRKDNYLDTYVDFTPKNYKYNGKWQSEIIDATALNIETPAKDRGARINAYAGDDTIYGSDWNDTIDGGDGDDIIYGGYGKNTINGGKGSDTYHLFYGDADNIPEDTTIKDSGKATDGTDTAILHVDSISNIKSDGKYGNKAGIWFNVKANGKQPTTTFYVNSVDDSNSATGKATITGVEEILVQETNGGTTKTYEYDYETVRTNVIAWLTSNGYKDAAQVINGDYSDRYELLELYSTGFVEKGATP